MHKREAARRTEMGLDRAKEHFGEENGIRRMDRRPAQPENSWMNVHIHDPAGFAGSIHTSE
jgi:hypothetical protein